MADPHQFEIIAAGELLVDMIGVYLSPTLGETEQFKRFQGGSTANLANNLNLLGKKTALVAAVGNDSLGQFLRTTIKKNGLSIEFIKVISNAPTTVILVSKTTGTPDFIAYRNADYKLHPSQLPDELVSGVKIFHTTCFGLSLSPAREIILAASQKAHENKATLSIDLNYAPQIWPDRKEALQVIRKYCQNKPLVKISLDDHKRLFVDGSPEDSILKLLDMGAAMVCLTLGKDGCKIGRSGSTSIQSFAVPQIEVTGDATGAGDAFWAGFLSGYLDNLTTEECVKAGMNLSALKLQQFGPLTAAISLSEIYD